MENSDFTHTELFVAIRVAAVPLEKRFSPRGRSAHRASKQQRQARLHAQGNYLRNRDPKPIDSWAGAIAKRYRVFGGGFRYDRAPAR